MSAPPLHRPSPRNGWQSNRKRMTAQDRDDRRRQPEGRAGAPQRRLPVEPVERGRWRHVCLHHHRCRRHSRKGDKVRWGLQKPWLAASGRGGRVGSDRCRARLSQFKANKATCGAQPRGQRWPKLRIWVGGVGRWLARRGERSGCKAGPARGRAGRGGGERTWWRRREGCRRPRLARLGA